MRFARLTAVVAPLALLLTFAVPAGAQVANGTKIAIANPVRIFNELKETKDLRSSMEMDTKNADTEKMTRQTKVTDIKQQRDQFNPQSPKYRELNQKLMEEAVAFESWGKVRAMGLANDQKLKIAYLYDKILQGIAKVAAQKKIDLVLAEQTPQLPDSLDQLTADQLRALLGQRNILYGSTTADISSEVIASMDADYNTSGGAGGAAGGAATGAATPTGAGTGTASGAK